VNMSRVGQIVVGRANYEGVRPELLDAGTSLRPLDAISLGHYHACPANLMFRTPDWFRPACLCCMFADDPHRVTPYGIGQRSYREEAGQDHVAIKN